MRKDWNVVNIGMAVSREILVEAVAFLVEEQSSKHRGSGCVGRNISDVPRFMNRSALGVLSERDCAIGIYSSQCIRASVCVTTELSVVVLFY